MKLLLCRLALSYAMYVFAVFAGWRVEMYQHEVWIPIGIASGLGGFIHAIVSFIAYWDAEFYSKA